MWYLIVGLGVAGTMAISFKNPRAIVWLSLGSFKVMFCTLYARLEPLHLPGWMPSHAFVSVVTVAFICHLLEKYKKYEWELILYRFGCLVLFVELGRFLCVPMVSEYYNFLTKSVYLVALVAVFANSLAKCGLLNRPYQIALNHLLNSVNCNSRKLKQHKGWAQRWV